VGNLAPDLLEAQRAVNKQLALMPQFDITTPEGLAMLRRSTAPPQPDPVLTPEDVMIAGPAGELRLRVFTPAGAAARAVFLRIHGGGWAAGRPEDDEAVNDQLARLLRIAVVSPDYRLAPQVWVPEQVEDILAAARWVAGRARDRFGTDRLLAGGISAGAHLAALLALRLRDLGEPAFAMLRGMHLDSGPYDMSGTPSARAADNATLVLPRLWLDGLNDLALPGLDREARRDPALSPLYASLHDMPPALFTVGALDPLVDNSVFMAARWQLAGRHADVDVWPEGAHAFANMGTPLAGLALNRATSWIDRILADADTQP
jgi:acetyl esterase/lipase